MFSFSSKVTCINFSVSLFPKGRNSNRSNNYNLPPLQLLDYGVIMDDGSMDDIISGSALAAIEDGLPNDEEEVASPIHDASKEDLARPLV